MYPEDEAFEAQDNEIGSDELLSEDDLRLPEGANILVRVHAVRAWLTRRKQDANLTFGQAALELQMLMQEAPEETRPRRRRVPSTDPLAHILTEQEKLQAEQARVEAYEEAVELFEDCLAHNTNSDRVLVEYYLAIEDILFTQEQVETTTNVEETVRQNARKQAFEDVLHRLERVTAPELD